MRFGNTPKSPVRVARAIRFDRVAPLFVVLAMVLALMAGLVRAQAQTPPDEAAIRTLDQAVSANPSDPVARVRLARALLDRGQGDRARFHLMQARGAPGLAPDDRAALDRILDRIDGARSREGWMRFAVVPETNPGQRTGAETISIGGLDFTLNPGARAAPATGVNIAFGGALMPRIGQGNLRLRIGGSVDARLFSRKALNDITTRGEFGLQGRTATGGAWMVWTSVALRHAAGREHGRGVGLHGSWQQMVGQSAQIRLRADLERWHHPGLPAQDGTRGGLSLFWLQALRPDLMVRAGGFVHRVNARAPWEAGRSAGISAGVQKLFRGGLVVSLDVTVMQHRRDGADPLLGIQRRDRRTSLTARVMHRTVTVQGFAPVLELGYDRQGSNNPLNRYRNLRASVGFTREF